MRRSTLLTFATTVLSSSALLVTNTFAADPGTYRPGNTYNSITANAPEVCEMQCSGDAQCRSWNYVRIGENAEGVCEFNDDMSSPVPSAISISGNNVSRGRSSRVVAGNTSTVRVGSPSVVQSYQRQPIAKASTPSASLQPATFRKTSPSASQPSYRPSVNAAANLSLMEQQRLNSQRQGRPFTAAPTQPQYSPPSAPNAAPRARQFQHSVEDGRTANAAPVSRPQARSFVPNTAPAPRQFQHSLEDSRAAGLPRTTHAAPVRAPQSQPFAPNASTVATGYADPRLVAKLQQRQRAQDQVSAPQNLPSYPTAAPQSAPQAFASTGGLSAPPGVPPLNEPRVPSLNQPASVNPSMAGAPPVLNQRRVNIPSELSPRAMGTGDNLFGSLYDDVKAPRYIDPEIASNPDLPFPTVQSAPTAQIQVGPLPPTR